MPKPARNNKANSPWKVASALGFGNVSIFFINKGIWVLALPFYQMTLGVDPFLLSLAASIPLLLSTAIGPWVGRVVDNSKNKLGTRKPFIVISAIICAVTYGAIWMVPLAWSQNSQFMYLFCLSLLFYLASSFFTIPMTCLSFESSLDSDKRTKTFAVTSVFVRLAAMVHHWAFPLSQLTIFSSAIVGIQVIGWFIGIFIIGLLGLLPIFFVHEQPVDVKNTQFHPTGLTLSNETKLTLKNKNFVILLLITALQVGGCAYAASMDYYLIVYYMYEGDIVEGSFWKGVLSTAFATAGLISVPLVVKAAKKFGQKQALQFLFLLNIIGGMFKWFVFEPRADWLLVIDAILCCSIWSGFSILVPSMLADICDREQQKSNRDNKGLYISLHNVVSHFSSSIAVIISGLTLNIIGFNAFLGAEQSSTSLLSMKVILVFGTIIFSFISYVCLKRFKFD